MNEGKMMNEFGTVNMSEDAGEVDGRQRKGW